jgi:hypothetical protein
MNQPESKFTKHAKKQLVRSDAAREMSPAERLTRAREVTHPTDATGQSTVWRPSTRASMPEDSSDDMKHAFAKREAAKKTSRTSGLVEDASVTAAREAYEAEKKAKTAPPAALPQLDRRDVLAMFAAFCQRTPQFKTTQWNCSQFDKAMTHFVNAGKVSFCSAGFERVFEFLSEKGYLEFVPGQNQGAPKEFISPTVDPAIEIRQKVKSGELRATKMRQAEEHETVEILAAKKMPFDQLQQSVRKNYKTKLTRRNTNV